MPNRVLQTPSARDLTTLHALTDDGVPRLPITPRARPIVRRWPPRSPQGLDWATLHATTDDGVPVALHGRSRRPRRRWSAQIAAREWATEHVATDDGVPVALHGRSRTPPRRWSSQIVAREWETEHSIEDDGLPRLPVTPRARVVPRRWPPRQPQGLDWATEHAATDDGSAVYLRARPYTRRRTFVLPAGPDLDQPEAPPAEDDGPPLGLSIPRARRPVRAWPSPQVALDWRTELAALDDETPVALHGRSRRPPRRWSSQITAREWETEHSTEDDGVPVALHMRSRRTPRRWSAQITGLDWRTELGGEDDGSPIALHGRARRIPRRWSSQGYALDWRTEHALDDDGVPVALHGRSRKPPRRWSAQSYSLDWRTEHATEDDATPLALHGRTRRPPRRWSAQASAREWGTEHSIEDDGLPRLPVTPRARIVPRRWAARSPQALEWSTEHSREDDGVIAGLFGFRRWRSLPGTSRPAVIVDEPLPVEDDGPFAIVLRRAKSAWRWLRPTPAISLETEHSAVDDGVPVALHGRSRQIPRRWSAQVSALDWRTEHATLDDGSFATLTPPLRRRTWRGARAFVVANLDEGGDESSPLGGGWRVRWARRTYRNPAGLDLSAPGENGNPLMSAIQMARASRHWGEDMVADLHPPKWGERALMAIRRRMH